jgi:hypothetical protein
MGILHWAHDSGYNVSDLNYAQKSFVTLTNMSYVTSKAYKFFFFLSFILFYYISPSGAQSGKQEDSRLVAKIKIGLFQLVNSLVITRNLQSILLSKIWLLPKKVKRTLEFF